MLQHNSFYILEFSMEEVAGSAANQKIPLWKQFLIFLKFKFIKIFVKIIVVIGLFWAFSGTWLGQKLKPLANAACGGTWQLLQQAFFVSKTSGQISLILALAFIILGKPIWKSLYFIIVFALAMLGIEHFVLKIN